MKENKKHFSKIGLIYLGGSALAFALQMGWAYLVRNSDAAWRENYNLILAGNMLPLFLIVYPLIVFLMSKLPKTELPKNNCSIGKWISLGITSIAMLYISNIIGTYINSYIGRLTGKGVVAPLGDTLKNIDPIFIFIFVVVLAPICEEIVFRKTLIDHTVKYGEGMAIVLSGLMFGLFHGNLSQFVYAVTLGMYFAYIYVRTGNIKYTIGTHMFVNFMGSFVSMLVMRNIDMDEYTRVFGGGNADEITAYVSKNGASIVALFAFAIMVIVLCITGIVLFFVNLRKMHLNETSEPLEKGTRFQTIYVNIGIALYFVAWLAVMVFTQIAG